MLYEDSLILAKFYQKEMAWCHKLSTYHLSQGNIFLAITYQNMAARRYKYVVHYMGIES